MSKKKMTSNLENSVAPSPAKSPDIEDDYQAKDHLRTLMDAHSILNDETKMEKVHKLAGRHHKAISALMEPPAGGFTSIAQLKDRRNQMAKMPKGD